MMSNRDVIKSGVTGAGMGWAGAPLENSIDGFLNSASMKLSNIQ